MQNRTDFGTPHFSTPQPNMDASSNDIAISAQMHKIIENMG